MKAFPLIAFLCLTSMAFAQKKIEVTEVKRVFSTGTQNALSFVIYSGNLKEVSKAWEKQLKELNGKVSTKKEFFADNCLMKEMGSNSFDVYSNLEESLGEGIRVYAAFDLGGAYLSMALHSNQFTLAKNILYMFAVEQNKAVVNSEIESASKVLANKEAELILLTKTQTQLEAEITDCLKKIEDSKAAIIGLSQSQVVKKSEIDAQNAVVVGLNEKLKAVN